MGYTGIYRGIKGDVGFRVYGTKELLITGLLTPLMGGVAYTSPVTGLTSNKVL